MDTSRQTKNLNKLLIRILLHLQVEFSYINREEPPFIEKRTFYRTNGELVIYVPKGCKERYKNSETWRTLNIIEME